MRSAERGSVSLVFWDSCGGGLRLMEIVVVQMFQSGR